MKNCPFTIVEKEAFQVVGVVLSTTNQHKEGRKRIPEFWKEAPCQQLLTLMNQEPYGLLGMSVYQVDASDLRKFEYYIGVASTQKAEGYAIYEVPAFTWAVFPCSKEMIGKTEALAITKWLPKSEYRPLNKGYLTGRMKASAPDIEVYGEGEDAFVWIAVTKK